MKCPDCGRPMGVEKLIVCPECTVPLKPGEPTYGALEEANAVMLEACKSVVKECTRCKDGLLLYSTSEADAKVRLRSRPCPCCTECRKIVTKGTEQ